MVCRHGWNEVLKIESAQFKPRWTFGASFIACVVRMAQTQIIAVANEPHEREKKTVDLHFTTDRSTKTDTEQPVHCVIRKSVQEISSFAFVKINAGFEFMQIDLSRMRFRGTQDRRCTSRIVA